MALLLPIIVHSSIGGFKSYALIDACGGCIPCLDEVACLPSDCFSNGGSPIQFECVAGRQAKQGEERVFIESSNSAFVFYHTCRELGASLAHATID